MSVLRIASVLAPPALRRGSNAALARVLRHLRSFRRDSAGSIAVMFALMFVSLALFVGAAVDIGRWLQARYQTVAALDAAVLAGARVLQIDNGDLAGARATAHQYFSENIKGRTTVVNESVSFDPSDDNSMFTGTQHSFLETTFLNFAHISQLPVNTVSTAALRAGGLSNNDVEISMMLDVTGSMKDSGRTKKISALKTAAVDLVNIVISDSANANPVRVAIVPFADAVRLPATSVSKAVGSPDKIVKKTSGSGNNQKTYLYNRSEHCVVERTGSNRYTDAAPSSGNYVTPFRSRVATISASQGTVLIDGKSTTAQGASATIQWKSGANLSQSQKNSLVNAANSFASCTIPTSGEIVPLTDDKATLIDRINDLPTNGMTAGQIGTAWAWYTLSPNWNSLWGASSAASAYGSGTRKIAILMTDGEYNMQYDANGIEPGEPGAGSAANGDSTSQARALCTAMKDKGITVYTVGFALGKGSTASKTLDHCATDPSKAYTPEDASELQQAFRDIALKINQLYLTH